MGVHISIERWFTCRPAIGFIIPDVKKIFRPDRTGPVTRPSFTDKSMPFPGNYNEIPFLINDTLLF
jgi:hypothetical protein